MAESGDSWLLISMLNRQGELLGAWTPIVSRRTRAFFALAALAPASILITRLQIASTVTRAQARGDLAAWVEPGFLSYLLLCIGLISFVAAMVSLVVDVRRAR